MIIRHGARLLAGFVALTLLAAPLPFGGATPGALAALQIAVFLLLALWLGWGELAGATGEEILPALRRVKLPGLALAAVALLGVIQALPWPLGILDWLSPGHARLYRQAGELLAGREMAAEPSLSLAASVSRGTALTFAALAAALALGALAGRSRRSRRMLGGALLAAALFQVLHGARGWFARATTIWGVEVPGSSERLRGSFVNPDHLALYLGMLLPAAFAWIWWAARRAREEERMDRRVTGLAPPCLVWLTLFTGLAFTGSRAGMIAAILAAVLQGLLIAGTGRRWQLAPAGAAAVGIGLGVVAAIGLEEGLGRLLGTSPYEVAWSSRREVYVATWELWRGFPLFGTGLGSFREAFPLVQPAGLAGLWRHAHSDPLELLATSGLLGLVLLLAGLGFLLRTLSEVLQRGRRSEDRAAGLAALGSIAALAIHEMFDFGLTLPANAFTLAIFLGAAAAVRLDDSASAK